MARLFLTIPPGLGRIAARVLGREHGVRVREHGNDGRADVLMVEAEGKAAAAVAEFDIAEEVCVEFGRTLRSEGDAAPWIAARLWRGERIDRALTAWSTLGGKNGPGLTFSAVVRVLRERPFRRTELRHEVARAVSSRQPNWRAADPARLEVWVSEYRPGRFVGGLRVPGPASPKRPVERPGSLRPAVAAAMVRLAGKPDGVLLDPCCGSGAVLADAVGRGWDAHGVDVDPGAVAATRRNAPGAEAEVGDVRRLALVDGSVAACVSNLPFGERFQVSGPVDVWLGEALAEMARVVRAGGRVVVLAPEIPPVAVPTALGREEKHRMQLLGMPTTLWVFRRR